MATKVLVIAAVLVLLGMLAWWELRARTAITMQSYATATEVRPFGPGWAADYGTKDEDRNLDGLDLRIEKMLREKRP